MALYDGFFDAEYSNSAYDRTYTAAQHVEYYSYFIGSGVCIADNEDSFLVSYSSQTATVAAGFLFINGYWLKNDADYTISLPSTGTYAILAKLDTTNRYIYLTYQAVASSYSNALCLASINIDTGVCTDTRDDDSICGIIDSIGNVSDKAAYAKDYMDDTVASTLETLEANVTSAVSEVSNSASEIEAMADLLGTPPVGELKYACAAPSDKWLACDGSSISTSTYSDLASLLGKLELRDATDIWDSYNSYGSMAGNYLVSNPVINGSYMYFAKLGVGGGNNAVNLVRVTLSDLSKVEIYVTSLDDSLTELSTEPNTAFGGNRNPLCLSVCTYSSKVFFFISQQMYEEDGTQAVTMLSFTLSGTTVSNVFAESSLHAYEISASGFATLPYVRIASGKWYYTLAYENSGTQITSYVVYCSVLPLSSNTISASSYTTTSYSTVAQDYTKLISSSLVGYTSKNSLDGMIIAGSGKEEDGSYYGDAFTAYVKYTLYSSTSASYQGTYTNVNYDESDDDWIVGEFEEYSGSTSDLCARNLPVYGSGYIIGPVNIGYRTYNDDSTPADRVICAMVLKVSGKLMYNIHLDENASPYARIFPESVCYADGYYFVFVGCGIYYTATPADEDSWTYISTLPSVGCVVRNGGIIYDSAYSRLIVFGITADLVYVVKALPLTNFASVSDSTIALPNTSKGNLQGYIKALEG